ncbi:hypothetical protein L6452_39083 [Arctium lappa]|uniref:Uncharacterized protein n=1 Tax=Arctium lappa TaxID=4217 RepID=A0ACB8XVF8_ARCLA|nr:hypothetical protein L6452_39083 [Arctium lappa]
MEVPIVSKAKKPAIPVTTPSPPHVDSAGDPRDPDETPQDNSFHIPFHIVLCPAGKRAKGIRREYTETTPTDEKPEGCGGSEKPSSLSSGHGSLREVILHVLNHNRCLSCGSCQSEQEMPLCLEVKERTKKSLYSKINFDFQIDHRPRRLYVSLPSSATGAGHRGTASPQVYRLVIRHHSSSRKLLTL